MILTIALIAGCIVAVLAFTAFLVGVRKPSIENLLNNIEDEKGS